MEENIYVCTRLSPKSYADIASPVTNTTVKEDNKEPVLKDRDILPSHDDLHRPKLVQKSLDQNDIQITPDHRADETLEKSDLPIANSFDIPKSNSDGSPTFFGSTNSLSTSDICVDGSLSTSVDDFTCDFPIESSNGVDEIQFMVETIMNAAAKPIRQYNDTEQISIHRACIETSAPFESVKDAVKKIGGITDWTAHKKLTAMKQKLVEQEIEKVQEEIPLHKAQLEASIVAKAQAVSELDGMKKLMEELQQKLKEAEIEEAKAKVASENAISEIERGVAAKAQAAARPEVEITNARKAEVVAELKSVKEELESLRSKYASLINDRDEAIETAQKAALESTRSENAVVELMMQLNAAKEALESTRSAQMEAEEEWSAAATAREREYLDCKKELRQAEEEVNELNRQIVFADGQRSKLNTASALMLNLETEYAMRMKSRSAEDEGYIDDEDKPKGELENYSGNPADTQATLTRARKELEEGKADIERAKHDLNCLSVAENSLKLDLEREKAALSSTKEKMTAASEAVVSLREVLNEALSELELAQMKEKDAKEMMEDLSSVQEEATQKANQANMEVKLAHEDLLKVKAAAEQAKADLNCIQIRVNATLKEIDAAKASERLSLDAVRALQESGSTSDTIDEKPVPNGVSLSLDEYKTLSRKAWEVEEKSRLRVEKAMSEMEKAKQSMSQSLTDLEETNKKLSEKKEALKVAMERADAANEGKLSAEQELRNWRSENEKRRKAAASTSGLLKANPSKKNPRNIDGGEEFSNFNNSSSYGFPSELKLSSSASMSEYGSTAIEAKLKKKKKSFFPRFVLFTNKKKPQSTN